MGVQRVATIALEADASQVDAARRFVRRVVADHVDPVTVGDLQLIVSELFTNALEHGSGDCVTVDVEETPTAVGVTVHSTGRADVGPRTDWAVAEPPEITGRGLGIVRELADELVIGRNGSEFVVTAWRSSRDRADV
jgi:anti-sigma regulatory factor (Ser/Thr protein kinase)